VHDWKSRVRRSFSKLIVQPLRANAVTAFSRAIVGAMPRVSAFYGVVIYMYWNERDHPVAHFHAYHAGRRASISADGNVLAGELEVRALQFVREWARLRHKEIAANWERARRNEPLLSIPPLP
jgi:hypothetical protein